MSRLARYFARLVVLLSALGVTSCGSSNPTAAGPSNQGTCHARDYPGATGGERIQQAMVSGSCAIVTVDSAGPDAGGRWAFTSSVTLRSGTILEGTQPHPVLVALNGPWTETGMLLVSGLSNVTLRHLDIQGEDFALNGISIGGSTNITIDDVSISRMRIRGVHVRDLPSSDISILNSTFHGNGVIDVRTESSGAPQTRVIVASNTMSGTFYGVAFADCGVSATTRCEARTNTISPSGGGGSGIDLNRGHYALVRGNVIHNSDKYGVSVDDTRNALITGNTVDGSRNEGIVLANGALAKHRPWSVSDNTVSGNTVTNSGGAGLASFHTTGDPGDTNANNIWQNNRIEGNQGGGCKTNVDSNSFIGNGPQACAPQH